MENLSPFKLHRGCSNSQKRSCFSTESQLHSLKGMERSKRNLLWFAKLQLPTFFLRSSGHRSQTNSDQASFGFLILDRQNTRKHERREKILFDKAITSEALQYHQLSLLVFL